MNQKKAKRLRREARQQAKEQMIPKLGYNAKETQKEVVELRQVAGTIAPVRDTVTRETLSVHEGTERGIYLKMKKEAK